MKSRFLLPVFTLGSTVFLFSIAYAYDPYQSRIDREYKSLSNSISRAYSVPSSSYTTRSTYSNPSYSSSNSSSSSRSYNSYSDYSNSSSKSSYWQPKTAPTPAKSWYQLEQERKEAEVERVAYEKERQKAIAEKKAQAAAAYKRKQDELNEDWARFRRDTNRAPLNRPPEQINKSYVIEYDYFEGQARLYGKEDMWSNWRVAQMNLSFIGRNPEPAKAFEFLQNSDPSWAEVQWALGICYLNGYGTPKDPQKAVEFLTLAAKNENKWFRKYTRVEANHDNDYCYRAARDLALAYDYGTNLPQDLLKASKWYSYARWMPLHDSSFDELKDLITDFWKRNAKSAPSILNAAFEEMKESPDSRLKKYVSVYEILKGLRASGDTETMLEVGKLVDPYDESGKKSVFGHGGVEFFLEAAQRGNEEAMRRFFSPSESGAFFIDYNFFREYREFLDKNWPKYEAKWKSDVANGDSEAAIPLFFHYSGVRGNPKNMAAAEHYYTLLPKNLSPLRKKGLEEVLIYARQRDDEIWRDGIMKAWDGPFAPTGAVTAQPTNLDLSGPLRTATPQSLENAAKLRDEANQLAASKPKVAFEKWVQASAAGDLPSLVQLALIAQNTEEPTYRASHLSKSNLHEKLVTRLETAAKQGDMGAAATLGAVLDSYPNNKLAFYVAELERANKWMAVAAQSSQAKAAYLVAVDNPTLSEEAFRKVRADVLNERAKWEAEARKWGFEGHRVLNEISLTPDEIEKLGLQHDKLVSLQKIAARLDQQLPLLEASVSFAKRDVMSDARYLQGYDCWNPNGESEPDIERALNYFSESAGLGHPASPWAIAFFYRSGAHGFPKNAATAKRWRQLADARLTAMANAGNVWAQTILGDKLTENYVPAEDQAVNFEWLEADKARGMKWLQTAALNCATLPRAFGDSSGQTVASWVANLYESWGREAEAAKWRRIQKVVEDTIRSNKYTPALRTAAQEKAKKILMSKA